MVLEALRVAVGQAGEPPQAHAHGQVEPLDMAGAYIVFLGRTEDRQLLSAYYPSGAVAGGFLSRALNLYQLGKINLHPERKRNVLSVRP
jgi:hypothetical protein